MKKSFRFTSFWYVVLALSLVLCFLYSNSVAGEQSLEKPLQVGSQKQLFIDHKFIQSKQDIELVVNPPVKRPGAILHSDKPWDAFRLIWFSVAEDNGIFKMWYQAYDGDQWGGGQPRMCYAVSKDGLNWEKPNLGVVEHNGSKNNNIVLDDSKISSVFIDQNGKPEERYKMLYGLETRVGTSADGIHWTLPPEPAMEVPPQWDTQKQAWWDPRIQKYVVQLRVSVKTSPVPCPPFVSPIESDPPVVAPKIMRPGRALGRLEMDDITQPWRRDQIRTVMTADEIDPPDSDIYHTGGVYQYPYAADAYFMFPFTYQHFSSAESSVDNDGVNDVQFAASRDGIHWMRYDRKPYIPRGLPGDPDHGDTASSGYHIRKGNYLYHFYYGWPWTHGGYRALSEEDRNNRKHWGRGYYGVVVQRLDGFVSADAPYTGGSLATPPIVFAGDRLELNINVAAMGIARVEIQDGSGEPIPGFTLSDCDAIRYNDVAYVVKWKGNSDISALAGRPVRLKIFMRSAKLHAFQFPDGN